MRRTDIAKALGVTPIKVSMAIRQLVKYGEVKCKEIEHWLAMDLYGSKRRLRLYYIEEVCEIKEGSN
ncbi:MAG: hypothetical protein ACFFD1_00850 [Candidatus Thorarchaeota archaeon]